MARYPLNLPAQLKKEAEKWAAEQGVSLNQFIMWAVAEKVGALRRSLDDPAFPQITYRRGAAGVPTPVLQGTGIRVQTIVVMARQWSLTPEEIATQYELDPDQVCEALDFYEAHRAEIDLAIAAEQALELYLTDIVDAADAVSRFIEGVEREDFFGDEMRQSAVLQKLIVIGEAAALYRLRSSPGCAMMGISKSPIGRPIRQIAQT